MDDVKTGAILQSTEEPAVIEDNWNELTACRCGGKAVYKIEATATTRRVYVGCTKCGKRTGEVAIILGGNAIERSKTWRAVLERVADEWNDMNEDK